MVYRFFGAVGSPSSKITGWLHTRGTDVLDESNRRIIHKGVNYSDLTEEGYVFVKPDLTRLPGKVCQRWSAPHDPWVSY